MTSGSTFPQRLTKVDDLSRPDHSYLTADDHCLFLGEYTARKGFAYSATNQLIINFKKPVSKRGLPEWRYKEQAISAAATAFNGALHDRWLDQATLVPIPPSKAKSDPAYDDRMLRLLQAIRPNGRLDIRELIVQPISSEAAHESDIRPRPETLATAYRIDPTLRLPTPSQIGLVDDVLTTGAHFKAAQAVLTAAFPGVPIIGLFIARRVPEAVDFDSIFSDIL